MTQFVLVATSDSTLLQDGLQLNPIEHDPNLDMFRSVERQYLGSSAESRLLAACGDYSTGALFDEVFNLQDAGRDIRESALTAFLLRLIGLGISFAAWYGSEFEHLPVLNTESSILRELQEQTSRFPPEVWLAFAPAPRAV